ncbi:hypothetical protein JYU34_022725 [Plutella xylostella]|uniref:Uncharacterized protein n=1 Tax=Plutella xylostella TaxID=51655 RepID=A0ABQ7PPH4_PLUXY|nr:hypothetical protein JYU34_022725 [Plutella xylostella]
MKPKSSIGMVIHGSEQNMSAYGAAGPHVYPDAGPEPEEQWADEAAETEVDAPPPRPSSLVIEAPPPAPAPAPEPSPGAGAAAPRRDSQVTDQGYFDVKFYHNKLW